MSFEFHPGAAQALNTGGQGLLAKIVQISLSRRPDPAFKSERPISATITRKDILDDPIIWTVSDSGENAIVFIFKNNQAFGLEESAYKDVRRLADQVLKAKWARSSLGSKFVEQNIILWCRASFESEHPTELAEAMSSAAKNSIQLRTMWAPIAGLEVEDAFPFGFANIAPITKSMIDEMESSSLENTPQQADNIRELFKKLRSEMQGLAAVTFEFEAEPSYVVDKGLSVANDAMGLLRFFSDSSFNPWISSPNSPLGSEYLPKMNILVLGPEGSFSWTTGILSKNIANWSISNQDLRRLIAGGLNKAGCLLDETNLNQFQLKIRSSIITYTKGITLSEINDRLVYTLSALESLFLRNSSEPIQQNLGERMAFLVTKIGKERIDIVKNVRNIYNMRSQYVHHRVSAIEEESLQEFILIARTALWISLQQIDNFETIESFHDAIDELKFGGQEEESNK